jgi:uncharacterized protein
MGTTISSSPRVFLTAEWHYLAMLNYEIDTAVLAPFVPAGTELDFWNGKAYISLVGFLFRHACVGGIPIPFHRNFEEVNLRFYVRRKVDNSWQRGVVFIREFVPLRAVAFVARKCYNENYFAVPMAHRIEKFQDGIKSISYSWRSKGRENFMKVAVSDCARSVVNGSLSEFISEHYWGYTKQRDGSTMEYRVEHPRWRVWETRATELHCDAAHLYGENFREIFTRPPSSAFLADGSEVKVFQGIKLTE